MLVHSNFSVLYFHSDNESHQLDFRFLSKAYSIFSRECKHNTKSVWVIHPTVWVRLAHFFCTPFMDRNIPIKLTICQNMTSFYEDFEQSGYQFPQSVLKE